MPAVAPVIPPVIVPTVHVKLLCTEAVRLIFGPAPLQMLAVLLVKTTGDGFTVTVIVKGVPGHEPVVDAGVTIYATVPVNVLLGFVST